MESQRPTAVKYCPLTDVLEWMERAIAEHGAASSRDAPRASSCFSLTVKMMLDQSALFPSTLPYTGRTTIGTRSYPVWSPDKSTAIGFGDPSIPRGECDSIPTRYSSTRMVAV